MKVLEIDFAHHVKRYPAWVRLGLLALGVVSLLALIAITNQVKNQIATQNEIVLAKQNKLQPVKLNAQLGATLDVAVKTQQHLNMPWLETLSMLETVQANHQNIALLSVTPYAAKAEVVLLGEAQQFDDITLFLAALKKQPMVSDAVLQNQQLFDTETGKQVVQFNVVLAWKVAKKLDTKS
jgi:Fimbrial assembly protein (PilN)